MKKVIVTGLLAVASGVLFVIRRKDTRGIVPANAPASDAAVKEGLLRRYMVGLIVPVWIAAGVVDYLWHRRTKIETTSGVAESVVHWLMFAEAAPLVLGALLLEVNAGVLALMLAGFFIHEATAMVDVGFTAPRRLVPPGEQHTHTFLEGLPFAVVSFLAALNWEQFLALFGKGKEEPRSEIRLKQNPLPPGQLAAIVSAIAILDGVPHSEELWRCWQARRRDLVGTDTPAGAPELYGRVLVAE